MTRLAIGLLLATAAGCASGTEPDPDDSEAERIPVALVPVATGLDRPVLVTAPVADPRLFVVEQVGRVRVIDQGRLEPEPYLDLTDRVACCGERGLLGLAFDPDFRATERFFVSYTDATGATRVESYRGFDRGNTAGDGHGELFLEVAQPFGNHNGGHIVFGPDRMLYVGLGDGGSGGDPSGHGQDPGTLLGTILRIDVTQRIGPPYAIPEDNPFADGVGGRPEVWHWGLRNPWRFSFDLGAGHLYIGDVGQNRWEEIDVVPTEEGGHNFGWNTMEGSECFQGDCAADDLTLPTAVYSHDDGCSVTGGHVYRGRAIEWLQGRYLYADYCGGWIRSFRLAGNGTAVDPLELEVPSPGRITSFGEDSQGEVYVIVESGTVFRLAPAA